MSHKIHYERKEIRINEIELNSNLLKCSIFGILLLSRVD